MRTTAHWEVKASFCAIFCNVLLRFDLLYQRTQSVTHKFRYQQTHSFVYTLCHNTAITDMFRRLSLRHHQRLYLALHIKSICFVVGLNNISRTHYQENGYTNVWLCGKITPCAHYIHTIRRMGTPMPDCAVKLHPVHTTYTLSGEWVHQCLFYRTVRHWCTHSPDSVYVIYCSNLQRNIWILCEDLGTTPDDGVVICAETCRV
jgi:hypothetical protein